MRRARWSRARSSVSAINAHPVLFQRLGMTRRRHLQTLTGKAGDDLRGSASRGRRSAANRQAAINASVSRSISTARSSSVRRSGEGQRHERRRQTIRWPRSTRCLLTDRGTSVSSPDSWKRSTNETTDELWHALPGRATRVQAYDMAQSRSGRRVDQSARNLSRALVAPPTLTDEARLRGADAKASMNRSKRTAKRRTAPPRRRAIGR